MNDRLLSVYHRAPYGAKVIAATAQGALLDRWRYGRETERLVAEAIEREQWTPAQWSAWQQERLAPILHRAATRVPYYRAGWEDRRRRGDHASWEDLQNWPVLSKEELRRDPAAFVAADCDKGSLLREHTSGTSGTPLELWSSRGTTRQWYALFEARCRRWNGVARGSRWALLGGQLVAAQARRKPPFWVWNAAGRQLYMSVYHLAPDLTPAYLDALQEYRIEYLLGYPSALHSLAAGVLKERRRDLALKVVIANAEPLWPHQREAIQSAFGCRVVESYGTAEMVAGAAECEQGHLHYWPEAGILEVLAGGMACGTGTAGRFVCTSLLNADMPLVRYEIGDCGRALVWEQDCDCGRRLPRLPAIDGRIDDVVLTSDGREVGRLDPVFKGGLPVREAQIVQEALDRIRIKVVPGDGFDGRAERELTRRVRDRLGDVQVAIERVARLPRTRAGKMQAVVSLINTRPRS